MKLKKRLDFSYNYDLLKFQRIEKKTFYFPKQTTPTPKNENEVNAIASLWNLNLQTKLDYNWLEENYFKRSGLTSQFSI